MLIWFYCKCCFFHQDLSVLRDCINWIFIREKVLYLFLKKSQSHISNSTDFIQKIQQIRLCSIDLLVSFDVESLFTQVPIKDTLNIKVSYKVPLGSHPTNRALLNIIIIYFSYNNQFYEQTSGMTMGSPISPVITNIFILRKKPSENQKFSSVV